MVLVAVRGLARKAQSLGLTDSTRWGAVSARTVMQRRVMQRRLWRPSVAIAEFPRSALHKRTARVALARTTRLMKG